MRQIKKDEHHQPFQEAKKTTHELLLPASSHARHQSTCERIAFGFGKNGFKFSLSKTNSHTFLYVNETENISNSTLV